MTIYIAGKITGEANYKAKFQLAAESLEKMGHIVLNPATLPEGMTPEKYMAICIPMVLVADAVYMLPDWMESRGATIEHDLCAYIGKRIFYAIDEIGGAGT